MTHVWVSWSHSIAVLNELSHLRAHVGVATGVLHNTGTMPAQKVTIYGNSMLLHRKSMDTAKCNLCKLLPQGEH